MFSIFFDQVQKSWNTTGKVCLLDTARSRTSFHGLESKVDISSTSFQPSWYIWHCWKTLINKCHCYIALQSRVQCNVLIRVIWWSLNIRVCHMDWMIWLGKKHEHNYNFCCWIFFLGFIGLCMLHLFLVQC